MGPSQYDDSQTVFEACIVAGSDGRRTDENSKIEPADTLCTSTNSAFHSTDSAID
jgi:hypothetical protein